MKWDTTGRSEIGPWNPARLWLAERPSPLFVVILLAGYAAVTLWVTMHHEPWRDEADTWLVARDLPLADLPNWTRYAGTPGLWYVLLKPLAALNLPFLAQNLLHVALAWVVATVFLLTAPFSRLTRVLILTSYYMLYEYAVVARSYVLTLLFLFIAAGLYQRRDERPVLYAVAVALLANCNVHGAILAAMLLLLSVSEGLRRARLVANAIMVAGLVAAWWQLRPPPDAYNVSLIHYIDGAGALFAIGNAFIPGISYWISFPIAAALLVMVILALRVNRPAILFLLGALGGFTILFTFIWIGGYRHAGLIFIATIVSLWIAARTEETAQTRRVALLLNATLVASTVFGAYTAIAEVRLSFSNAKEMADYIRREGLDAYEIACHTPDSCVAIVPHLGGKQVWYAALEHHGTFLRWDRRMRDAGHLTNDTAIARARKHFDPQRKRWVLVLNVRMGLAERRGFRLLYATSRPVFRIHQENYWLYEPLPRN